MSGIDLNNKESGIPESFILFPHALLRSSDNFASLSETVTKVLFAAYAARSGQEHGDLGPPGPHPRHNR